MAQYAQKNQLQQGQGPSRIGLSMNIEGREAVFIDTGESLTIIRLCDDNAVVVDSDNMVRLADYGSFKLLPVIDIPTPLALRNDMGVKHKKRGLIKPLGPPNVIIKERGIISCLFGAIFSGERVDRGGLRPPRD